MSTACGRYGPRPLRYAGSHDGLHGLIWYRGCCYTCVWTNEM